MAGGLPSFWNGPFLGDIRSFSRGACLPPFHPSVQGTNLPWRQWKELPPIWPWKKNVDGNYKKKHFFYSWLITRKSGFYTHHLGCLKEPMFSWNPNDLYFWRSTPPKQGLSHQNKGHLGSRFLIMGIKIKVRTSSGEMLDFSSPWILTLSEVACELRRSWRHHYFLWKENHLGVSKNRGKTPKMHDL